MRQDSFPGRAAGLSADFPSYGRQSLGEGELPGLQEDENCTRSAASFDVTSAQLPDSDTKECERNTAEPTETIVSAGSASVKTKWFWYSIASCLCWTAWAFTARLASEQIPPATMQFISAFGFLFVGLALARTRKIRLTIHSPGSYYALLGGVLLGVGGTALYGAYRTGHDASVVTATTSLYPVVTVLFAVVLLRERPNRFQVLGIVFAVIAILLFSV